MKNIDTLIGGAIKRTKKVGPGLIVIRSVLDIAYMGLLDEQAPESSFNLRAP